MRATGARGGHGLRFPWCRAAALWGEAASGGAEVGGGRGRRRGRFWVGGREVSRCVFLCRRLVRRHVGPGEAAAPGPSAAAAPVARWRRPVRLQDAHGVGGGRAGASEGTGGRGGGGGLLTGGQKGKEANSGGGGMLVAVGLGVLLGGGSLLGGLWRERVLVIGGLEEEVLVTRGSGGRGC